MPSNIAFFYDILFGFLSLFSVIYIIYGRIRGKALIGGYRPGKPGYGAFRKIISNRNLIIAVALVLFFTVSTILDADKVLNGPSPQHSILIIAPILVITTFLLAILIIPTLFRKLGLK